ncbi:MAG: hypothetical protein ABJB97_09970 [Acidobacteriota bacterium]
MGNDKRAVTPKRSKSASLSGPPVPDQQIVSANIRALQPAYVAAMLEGVKLFAVADRLVELFQSGKLPLGNGKGGRGLFNYWKETPSRLSALERRNVYARAFNLPGGESEGIVPNREFNDLWLRFVSEVASLNSRKGNVAVLDTASQQEVRKAATDLAANLSLHGFGWVSFAATELQRQVNDLIKLLSDKEILSVYGARDLWQLIDQVSTLELGGSRNSLRYRTMGAAGATIIAWLAKKAGKLSSASAGSIVASGALGKSGVRRGESKAKAVPSDSDLVSACEQWLAVKGTPDD